MKKYIAGFAAVVVAVIALSFTTDVKKEQSRVMSDSEKAAFVDPCTDAQKRWFVIEVPCGQQTSVEVLRNAENYVRFGDGLTAPDKLEDCPGNTCLCAIFACPTDNTASAKPIITSATTIYSQLQTYFTNGLPVTGLIIEKN